MAHAVVASSSSAPAAVVLELESSCGDSGISNGSGSNRRHQGQSVGSQPQRYQLAGDDDEDVDEEEASGRAFPASEFPFHPMAMSAISEVPSPTTSKAPPLPLPSLHQQQQQKQHQQQHQQQQPNGPAATSTGVFPRNGRMTQSLTYGRSVSAQTRRQMLAHSLAMLGHETRSKQRDLDRREREVQDATTKATEQVEYMLKLTDKLHKCEDENGRLRQQLEVLEAEMGKLLDELQEKDTELEEKEDELARCSAYCDELLEELGRSRKDIAQIRAKADELRVEKVVLSRNRQDGQKSLTEWEEMKRANLRLQRQAAHAEKETRRARRDADGLRAGLEELQAEHQRLVDDFGDDERSKKELLQMIRRLAEDKLAWEAYCARLLRRAVRLAPQLLCLDGRASASTEAEEADEGHWEAMFNTLLRAVMQKDPGLADCVTQAASTAAAAAGTLNADSAA